MGTALRQKTNARRVLLVLIGLLAGILALQGFASVGPGGYIAFAQDPSPTGSGRTIKIVNPDETTSSEVSNKSDGVDAAYHLVAWVNNPQAGDAVEFKYLPDDQNTEISITCLETGTSLARFVSPDTYECHWDLSNVAEGAESGTVRAILFANSASVATDEEAVTVDRSAQTVEITYPTNGGQMGFYTASDGTSAGMIDFRTSGSTGEGDEGTQTVVAYYSISAPGSEPDFLECPDGAVATEPGSEDSVRCTLPADDPETADNEGHSPEQVTAVALVARDISEGEIPGVCDDDPPGNPFCDEPDPDSADAHRAQGYQQDPSTVLINPQTQTATPGACSQVITATVRDQNDRKVVGANVDVHAQGPTDNLGFDDENGTNTSPHQAPEGHSEEPGRDCEDTEAPIATGGTQGEHEQLEADIKHIESLPEGTDDNGEFTFQLFSPDAGGTQIRAWADEDFNDQFCSAEATGVASIGWGQSAPSPVGTPVEQETCPQPTPTGSPTQSPTDSPTSPGATTSGPTTDRTVTMTVSRSRVTAGRRAIFSGQILSEDVSCVDNEFVRIRRRVHGTKRFRGWSSTSSDAQGRFRLVARPRKSADYQAVAAAHDHCRRDRSGPVTVQTRVVLKILVSDSTPPRGVLIAFKSSVRPSHDGTKLLLQRKKGRRWVRVKLDRLNKRSVARFVIEANFRSRIFRTRWRSQDAEHESGTSRQVRVRTH